MAKAFVVKLGIYSLVSAYVLGDLFVFEGPIHSAVEKRKAGSGRTIVNEMESGKVAAYVYRVPIYLGQVDYEVERQLRMLGRKGSDLPKKHLALMRKRALSLLIDDCLLRQKVEGNERDLTNDEEAVEQASKRFFRRFSDEQSMKGLFEEQGIEGELEVRLRSKALLQQDQYLQQKLQPSIVIPQNAAANFYKNHYTGDSKARPFEKLKPEIEDALRAELLKKQVEEYRANLQHHAGVIHRYLDSSKDSTSRKDKTCRVEIYMGIFEFPYSQ